MSLLAGVGAGLIVKSAQENAPVEKVEAASKPSTVSTIGLRLNGSYWGQAGAYYTAHVWGGSTGTTWPGVSFDDNNKVSGGGKVIYADVSGYTGFTHIIILRWNDEAHTNEGNRWSYYDGNTFSANAYNFFDNDGWGSCSSSKDYLNGYYLIGNFSSSSWDMANAKAADSSTVSGNNASWSSVSFAANDQFKVCYYNMGGTYDYQNNGWSGQHSGFSWSTPYASNNITCSSAGTYKVFLDSNWKVAINKDVTITYYEYKDSTASSAKTTTGNTDIPLSDTLSGKFGTYTGYNIKEYRKTSSSGTVITLSSTYPTAAMSVYAIYQKNTYTITFNPNGGSGSTVTRSKTYNDTYTIPTPASLGIGAGYAQEMLSWNTNSSGTGTSYKIDGTSTYTTNAALTLFLIQGFKSYEYSVDGGSTWVQMPKTTTAEGCVATYASSASNYLPAGQIITIRGYYGSGTHTTQTINTWSGNQYESGGSHYVSIGTTNKIVLNVTTSGSFDVDVWGGSARGIAIDRSGFVTKYECELNETTHNFTGTVTVLPGDIIKAYYNYATVYSITMTNYDS